MAYRTDAEPTLGELVADLAQQVSTLLRQELRLASTEMRRKMSGLGRDVGLIAFGGALAYAGLLAAIAGLVLLVGLVLPLWAAALVVGVLVAAIGYAVVRSGLAALRRIDLAPQATIHSLREDVSAIREAA